MPHLAALPVPETNIPTAIPTHDELTVRTHTNINSIASIIVTAKALLAILAKAIRAGVDDDLIIAGLKSDVLPRRVGVGAHHAVHVRLGDELDGDGDVVLPRAQGLVVRGGDEAAVGVDEGDGVDGAEVVVVLLRERAGAGVELDDLLVRHAREELVRVRGGWVEANDVRDLARAEAGGAFAVFGVPQLHLPVVGGGEEVAAGGVEGGVADGFAVARVGAQQVALVVDVPELDFAVGRGGEEEVAGVGEEAQGGDGFGVRFPGVDVFLRDVVLLRAGFLPEVDVEILGYVHVRSPLVVELLAAVELGSFGVCDVVLVVGAGFAHGWDVGRDDGFVDVLLVARQLFAGHGRFVLVRLVLIPIPRPRSFVRIRSVYDARISFFLPFPSDHFAVLFRRPHLHDIPPSEFQCFGQIPDIRAICAGIPCVPQTLKCAMLRVEGRIAEDSLLRIPGQNVLPLQRIAISDFVRICWSCGWFREGRERDIVGE